MTARKISVALSGMLALTLGIFALPALAQHDDMHPLGKKGEISFDSPVRVGSVSLSAATYQVQHVVEGYDHFIVFRKIVSGPYSGGVSGKESARVKCRLEPLGEKTKSSGLRLGVNSAGEKTLEEVRIRGENVKHLF
jgi:hypothetical protein